jgi:hypothetical protein
VKGGKRKMEKGTIDWIVAILVVVGALNWGLYGALGMDLVSYLSISWLMTTVYILIGLSGIWMLYKLFTE